MRSARAIPFHAASQFRLARGVPLARRVILMHNKYYMANTISQMHNVCTSAGLFCR